jgi:hypothetical protein
MVEKEQTSNGTDDFHQRKIPFRLKRDCIDFN